MFSFSLSLDFLQHFILFKFKCFRYLEQFFFFFFFFFCLLQLYLQHMEVPRLGFESAYVLAYGNTRSKPHQIFNPLSKARDQTCILTDTTSGS